MFPRLLSLQVVKGARGNKISADLRLKVSCLQEESIAKCAKHCRKSNLHHACVCIHLLALQTLQQHPESCFKYFPKYHNAESPPFATCEGWLLALIGVLQDNCQEHPFCIFRAWSAHHSSELAASSSSASLLGRHSKQAQ